MLALALLAACAHHHAAAFSPIQLPANVPALAQSAGCDDAAFQALLQEYTVITAAALPSDESAAADLLKVALPAQIKAFSEHATAYAGTDTCMAGGRFLAASARLSYANLGLSVRPPDGLSRQDKAAYEEILRDQFYPLFGDVQTKALTDMRAVASTSSPWAAPAKALVGTARS